MVNQKKIKVAIADSSYLSREGFKSIVGISERFEFCGEATTPEELASLLEDRKINILIIDYTCGKFTIDDISFISENYSSVELLAITGQDSSALISKAIACGVRSHLLKDCNKEEIIEAMELTATGHPFFCGKIVNHALNLKTDLVSSKSISCDGIKLSGRETQIIQHISEGLTNKQIAEKLFLSTHTVSTHRKNIMQKLGVTNAVELVMQALKSDLITRDKLED